MANDVTQLIVAWKNGDQEAFNKLLPLVYDELRIIAGKYFSKERRNHTLQTTALVHEAYLRMVDQHAAQLQNRAHFFAIAAQMMRRVLVDYAYAHKTGKRGGDAVKLSLDEAMDHPEERDLDIVALDDALKLLAAKDKRKSRIVELRFFGGLDLEETAEVLGVSLSTVRRDWEMARAWLYRELQK